MRRPGFTRELCSALAHRWQPERIFMFVYTAYLDESGTHGGSEVTIMGGMLARAEQWERFQKAYNELKKKCGFRRMRPAVPIEGGQ